MGGTFSLSERYEGDVLKKAEELGLQFRTKV
jgi:hypothetical protein